MNQRLVFAIVALLLLTPFALAEYGNETDRDFEINMTRLFIDGKNVTDEEATKLEAHLQETPDDLEARTRLIGHYANKMRPEGGDDQLRHVLWIVNNQPKNCAFLVCKIDFLLQPDNAQKLIDAWHQQLEQSPEDTRLLYRASNSARTADEPYTWDLLRRGSELEPDNPYWPRTLAHGLGLSARRDDEVHKTALREEAYALWLEAHDKTSESDRAKLYFRIAQSAFEASEVPAAEEWARKAIDQFTNPESVHVGNQVLGNIALRKQKVDEAEKFLLASADVKGGRRGASFWPEMDLAQQLLTLDRHDAVAKYLDSGSEVWKRFSERLECLSDSVSNGESPELDLIPNRNLSAN